MAKSILDILFGKPKKKKDLGDRAHPRLKAFNLIKFTLSDGTHYESISNIINISETGLQFTTYEQLAPGQPLRMLISIPHANKEVPIKANLVWIRKDKVRKGIFLAGVRFEKIEDSHRELIREMIQARKQQRPR